MFGNDDSHSEQGLSPAIVLSPLYISCPIKIKAKLRNCPLSEKYGYLFPRDSVSYSV